MRKFLLFGTALMVASSAFAFSGMGILGSKSSNKTNGVDAIGVHIDNTGKKANITITNSDSNEPVTKECEWGWTLNTETNECECPEERRCGETCCGVGNICNTQTNQCCYENYQEYTEDPLEMCCDANESMGYANQGGCCGVGETLYAGYRDADHLESYCCPSGNTLTPYGNEESGGFVCCEAGLVGYRNGDGTGCCAHTLTHIVDTDFCCEENETAYCARIHFGQCEEEIGGCCAGSTSCTNVANEDELKRCGCCPTGQSVYCPDADCEQDEMPCCSNDKISYGTGENGADECLE